MQALPMHEETLEDAAQLLYVAMTRATHELVLAAHGTSSIVVRVQAPLVDVVRRLPRPPTQPEPGLSAGD